MAQQTQHKTISRALQQDTFSYHLFFFFPVKTYFLNNFSDLFWNAINPVRHQNTLNLCYFPNHLEENIRRVSMYEINGKKNIANIIMIYCGSFSFI